MRKWQKFILEATKEKGERREEEDWDGKEATVLLTFRERKKISLQLPLLLPAKTNLAIHAEKSAVAIFLYRRDVKMTNFPFFIPKTY